MALGPSVVRMMSATACISVRIIRMCRHGYCDATDLSRHDVAKLSLFPMLPFCGGIDHSDRCLHGC